jgi:hypothetical protein
MNASIVGATGVLNRVSEDGLLFGWFREPHHRYGTSYRIINMVAVLQIAAIVLSRGDIYLLGNAYAFRSFTDCEDNVRLLPQEEAGARMAGSAQHRRGAPGSAMICSFSECCSSLNNLLTMKAR